MKTLKNLLFILLLFNLTQVFGQKSKVKRTEDLVLQFDYKEKTWNYDSTQDGNKHKPYFLVKYKSQPVIKVTSLPSTTTKVTIDEYFFDVTPEVETKDKSPDKSLSDGLIVTPFIQTMAVVDSDEVSYKVTIKDANDETLHTTAAFVKVYGRLKIDLSTGVLFHNLQDESYYFSDAENGQSSISKDRNKGEIKPLFPAVLTHFYWQGKGSTNFGASIGFGLDDSGKIGYYTGPALIVGDRQRVILSGGWALRPTDVLIGKYREGQLLNTSNLPDASDLVESEYKSGIFLSLTYNLTSKVEKR